MNAKEMAMIANENGFKQELEEEIRKQNQKIRNAAEMGRRQTIFNVHETIYDYLESQLKEYYLARGFSFKPVGYNGGVWQKDIYICW